MDPECETEDLIQPISRPEWVTNHLDGATGKDVRVGVIDSGWDRSIACQWIGEGVGFVHPNDDLATQKTDDYHDRLGHGTACGTLIHQIAPEATLHPIRVFGRCRETSPKTIIEAIDWSIQKGLDVINISLSTLREDTVIPFYKICQQAVNEDITVISSCYNGKSDGYPAIFDNVISVSFGYFENPFNYEYSSNDRVECKSKGYHENVLCINKERKSVSGTSFASPNIAGVVSLIKEGYPNASLQTVRRLIEKFSVY
jgi:subtilisin family serine protease